MKAQKQTAGKSVPSGEKQRNASPARSAALHALQTWRKKGAVDGVACQREDDTHLAERLLYGVLQNERFLDSCISRYLTSGKTHPVVRDLLRLTAYQILFLDRVPVSAAVNDAVLLCRASGQGYAAGLVNAVSRRIASARTELLADDGSLAVRYSHPDWLVEELLHEHDREFVSGFLKSNGELPDVCLQLDTGKTDLEHFLRMLQQQGIEPTGFRRDFPSVRIHSMRIDKLQGYGEGLFFVQDDAARAAVKMLGLKRGQRVLDACSAPGGKSMAAALEGAEVVSCDASALRLKRCEENYARMKMDIPTLRSDATEFISDFREAFDAVIADVPCTGTGVVRRHPEIRQRSREELEALLPLQRRILENLSSYVRPGGSLVYSTCSVLREEDETQVELFLRKHPEFCLSTTEVEGFDFENEMLRSWPHRSGSDGFFAAKLVKRND